ncbi:MAG: methionyl-tRNA formyltransferase [Methylophilaceae bacterium]
MKLIFAGTPDFAVPALAALITAGHQIVLVLTQPDRPSGRGMKLKASPVKELALQHRLAVFQPETLKDAEVQAHIASVQADAMIVAAYGLIIPTVVLHMPRYGCFNIHASLLPRWRGAAPIQRALLAGDKETGVTIMEVVPALDAGAMITHETLAISERDTAQTLHDGLASLGAKLMVQAMEKLALSGQLPATPQDESLVTYAHKLNKTEANLDWTKGAAELSRQIRAFNPFPVAQAMLHGETCRIWMAQALPADTPLIYAAPGTIIEVADGITVACGEGVLRIEELQMPGGKRLRAREFLAGHAVQIGETLAT